MYQTLTHRKDFEYELSEQGDILIIKSAPVQFSGEYSCEARNIIGKAKKTFDVSITSKTLLCNFFYLIQIKLGKFHNWKFVFVFEEKIS